MRSVRLADEVRSILSRLGVSPQKRRSQNFMVDEAALGALGRALAPKPGETVLEIGPGLGFLTQALLDRGARVIAVEKDFVFARFLKSKFKGQSVRVLEQDILELDPRKDLELAGPLRVAGNIPYHITGPILEWLISQRGFVSRAVLTVQWEVALRLAALSGKKARGSLSVFVQLYSDVSIVQKIGRASFYPSPKVDSAVVALDFLERARFPIEDEDVFLALVRRSFQKRRKTLVNSLAEGTSPRFSKKAVTEALQKAAVDPARRPETLSLEEWVRFSKNLLL